jgi:hypothetical protein
MRKRMVLRPHFDRVSIGSTCQLSARVLGGGDDIALDGEVGETGIVLGGTHVIRMALVVKKDKAAGQTYKGFFQAVGVVYEEDGITHLIKEFLCQID